MRLLLFFLSLFLFVCWLVIVFAIVDCFLCGGVVVGVFGGTGVYVCVSVCVRGGGGVCEGFV